MRKSALLIALAAVLAAGPAVAQDLIYRHIEDGPDMLERSDGKAFWLLLAECSGFYGALSNRETDLAQSQVYLNEGVSLFTLGLHQAQADRGLARRRPSIFWPLKFSARAKSQKRVCHTRAQNNRAC